MIEIRTELEQLKEKNRLLKIELENKCNQVESKNRHISRLEKIISTMKKKALSSENKS